MTVDFHTHAFPDRIAASTVARLESIGGIPSFSDGTVEGLKTRMRQGRISLAINLPVLTKPTQAEGVNAFAASLNANSGVDIAKGILSDTPPALISFAGIHPDVEDADEYMSELRRLGFLGIKIHPDYQGVLFDDERYIRIMSAAKREGLITVTHAGIDAAFPNGEIGCTPDRVLRALDKLGGYDRLVLAHLGGNEMQGEVAEKLAGEEIYFDTSLVLPHISRHSFEKVISRHDPRHILFGSDSPWSDIEESRRILHSFVSDPDTEEMILVGNALELLRRSAEGNE